MNKSKHRNITYCPEKEAEVLVNDPRFESLEEFTEGYYEVCVVLGNTCDLLSC